MEYLLFPKNRDSWWGCCICLHIWDQCLWWICFDAQLLDSPLIIWWETIIFAGLLGNESFLFVFPQTRKELVRGVQFCPTYGLREPPGPSGAHTASPPSAEANEFWFTYPLRGSQVHRLTNWGVCSLGSLGCVPPCLRCWRALTWAHTWCLCWEAPSFLSARSALSTARDFTAPTTSGSQFVRGKLFSLACKVPGHLSLFISLASSPAPVAGTQTVVMQSCLQVPKGSLQKGLSTLLHLPWRSFPRATPWGWVWMALLLRSTLALQEVGSSLSLMTL